jgi:hypothetical protein
VLVWAKAEPHIKVTAVAIRSFFMISSMELNSTPSMEDAQSRSRKAL